MDLVSLVIEILETNKAKNIEAFSLVGKSPLIKNIVLASTLNEQVSKQLSLKIEEEISAKSNIKIINKEGYFPGDWIILDYGDVLIEIFCEDTRKFYNLEKLWGTSKNKLAVLIKSKKSKK